MRRSIAVWQIIMVVLSPSAFHPKAVFLAKKQKSIKSTKHTDTGLPREILDPLVKKTFMGC